MKCEMKNQIYVKHQRDMTTQLKAAVRTAD